MNDDLISRQAAIDAIGKTADELYENIKKGATFPQRQWFDGMAQAQSILEDLPAAQPQRMRGKWVDNSPVTMKCDQCGIVIKDWDWFRFKICPGCGADMRGEQDGQDD